MSAKRDIGKRWYYRVVWQRYDPLVDWPKEVYDSLEAVEDAWRAYCATCARKGHKPSYSVQGDAYRMVFEVHRFPSRRAADDYTPGWDKSRPVKTLD